MPIFFRRFIRLLFFVSLIDKPFTSTVTGLSPHPSTPDANKSLCNLIALPPLVEFAYIS